MEINETSGGKLMVLIFDFIVFKSIKLEKKLYHTIY